MTQAIERSQELPFIRPNKLSFAISAVLAVPAATAVAQDQEQEGKGGFLEEILVTATKRTESMQDIPQSIQAISEEDLKVAGLQSMDDYVRFIPSMSYVSSNPGTARIVFRGIADAANTFIAESASALYIDEQSLTLNATPDPRMVDIERVEALSGPQGTLYGASAQAGTLRIITNKPDPSAFAANIDLMLKGMSEGDASYDASAMVNIPLSDTAAIRLVGFSARDGGFIDNVLGSTPRFGLYTNAGEEKENFNEVNHSGGRVTARFFPNDDWTVTAGLIYQKTESEGRPEMNPFLGDLKIVRFNLDQEYDNQDWKQYSLTFEGDLGFANFVSATSYFERDWEYTQNTEAYASYFGTFCYGGHYDAAGYWQPYVGGYSPYCFQPAGVGNYYNDPIGYLRNTQNNTKFSQEFRLSAQGEKIDWVAGVFYEKATEDWDFWTFTEGYDESQGDVNWYDGQGRLLWKPYNIPTQRLGYDAWWTSFDRSDFEQKAVFGEVTFHLGDKVDLLVGARWFDRTMDKEYWTELPPGNRSLEGDADGILRPSSDDSDVIPKFSIKYQLSDNAMVYGLYSEGFRPGGTNRGRGIPFFGNEFRADYLDNFEVGFKSVLNQGKVRLNATYFDMTWNDYQLEMIDPSNVTCGSAGALPEPYCSQPWQKIVANVGDASSSGLEVNLDVAPSENVTWGINTTFLDATVNEDLPATIEVPAGSRLPLSPEFKASAYFSYDFPVNWMNGHANSAYIRLQASHVGDMLNQVEPYPYIINFEDGVWLDNDGANPAPQLKQPAYTIGDIKFGIVGDDWSVQFFVNNVTDERAVLFDNPNELERYFSGWARQTVNRPREYGVRFSKSFSR
jgi:outer membrane receptor protein involved in Fe transport